MITVDKRNIEEILLEQGILKNEDYERVIEAQKSSDKEMEEFLLDEGLVTKVDILKVHALKMQVEFIDLTDFQLKNNTICKIIAGSIAKRYRLIPVFDEEGVLTVAMKDPTDIFVIDDLRLATTRDIKAVFADLDQIERLLPIYYPEEFRQNLFKPQPSILSELEKLTSSFPNAGAGQGTQSGQPAMQDGHDAIQDGMQGEQDINQSGSDEENKYNEETPSHSQFLSDGSSLGKDRLGRLMVMSGVITEEQLGVALGIQSKSGGLIGEILIEEGYIAKKTLYGFLEVQLGVPHIEIDELEIDEEVIKTVNENICRRYTLIPIEKDGMSLKVAMSDPMDIFTVDDLRLSTGCEIIPLLADSRDIKALINHHFPKVEEIVIEQPSVQEQKQFELDEEIQKVSQEITVEMEMDQVSAGYEVLDINDVSNAPIVKMVNIMFNRAVSSGASDIHIEPYEDCVMVRFRIDGQLVEVMKYDKKILQSLVARVKIISGLNIAEKRLPQDGRITMKIDNRNFDLRVSVLPTHFGEKIVIRISDKEGFKASKTQLGFFEDDMAKFDEIISHPHGIMLVTGPTGSGKSTTLYAALQELCKPNVNIMTVEDPIESVVRGANQVQVNMKAGMTFAAALRSFLRQDPDIIMLGEIRDGETAEIATRAAITGHLVLSTLHTNDAASAITRLTDMGIEPFMVSSSIVGVIAQRLVRRLCTSCKEAYHPGISEIEALEIQNTEEIELFKPKGCSACNNTGYKGRIAIYEIMTINREIRDLVAKNDNVSNIKDAARRNGMMTVRDNCVRLVRAGVTSIDELLKVSVSKD